MAEKSQREKMFYRPLVRAGDDSHGEQGMTLGEFIVVAYDAWGRHRGKGIVRLALNAHLIKFQDCNAVMVNH